MEAQYGITSRNHRISLAYPCCHTHHHSARHAGWLVDEKRIECLP